MRQRAPKPRHNWSSISIRNPGESTACPGSRSKKKSSNGSLSSDATWQFPAWLFHFYAQLLSVEDQGGAGEARFGLLEFGDVDCRDVDAAGFDTFAGVRERGGENDGTAKSESIGGMGLGGIDVDPVVDGKRHGVKPGAIGEKRVAADVSDGGLEVQAAGDGHRDDLVIVGSQNGGELAKALGVAAPSETDEKFAADTKDVAAFEGAGERDVGELSKGRNGFGERGGFGAARRSA